VAVLHASSFGENLQKRHNREYTMDPSVAEKLKNKFGAPPARTGGKGTVRRKKKTVRKSATQDDKKLQSTLKKLNVNLIPAIEEVNLFKDDNTVIHFSNPKVQASIPAHTYVVSGNAQTKNLTEMFPSIISQLGPDNIESLKKLVGAYQAAAAAGGAGGPIDEEVPDLVDNFEATAEDEEDDDGPTVEDA
jgi:nascent polypeptide-associated complex subunit beta